MKLRYEAKGRMIGDSTTRCLIHSKRTEMKEGSFNESMMGTYDWEGI